jgi:hypothetical protein
VLAALVLHTFQIVLFGHLIMLCVAPEHLLSACKRCVSNAIPAAMFLPAFLRRCFAD